MSCELFLRAFHSSVDITGLKMRAPSVSFLT
jgi:hypothetical protein